GVLHPVVNIHWGRAFNLRTHYLLIKTSDTKPIKEVMTTPDSSPFLYTIHEFIDGESGILLVFLLPHTTRTFKVLRGYTRKLAKHFGGKLLWFQNTPLAKESYNLRYYEEGRWQLHWVAWRYWLERCLSGEIPVEPLHEPFPLHPRVKITQLDASILQKTWQTGRIPQRQLCKLLKVGPNLLNQRLRFLKANNIIQYRFAATNLGLIESTLLLISGQNMSSILNLPFSELPEYYLRGISGDISGCIYMIRLPQGGFHKLGRILRETLQTPFTLHLAFTPTGSQWQIPLDHYDWNNHQFNITPDIFPLPSTRR
ncbi:MAG: hypothetical protein ACFFCO_12920, partial [Promethearchaeota archaeon]